MNRLNMNDADCSFDDLLCQSLSLFHQFRLYDDRMEEDNAFKFLREAEKVVADNTDGILEEVDTFLIKFWKGIKQPSSEAFIASLWVGEYFLLRLKNPESRFRSRSKKMVSKILSFMADMLRKPEKQKALTLSSVVVLEETVDWIKEICDMHICEKQLVVLLERLYHLQEIGMLQQEEDETKNTLRRQMWDFYY